MKNLVWIAPVLLSFLAGCSSSQPAPVSGSSEKTMMAKDAGAGYYAEESFKGRLYVLGTEKAHQALTESHHAPQIAKAYIGAGPDGQTIVVEADAKSNDLQERLKAQYESRHGTKLP